MILLLTKKKTGMTLLCHAAGRDTVTSTHRHQLLLLSGRSYSKQGSVRKKMWGSSPWAAYPIFPGKKLAIFLVITVRASAVSSPEKLATFFGHHCRFYSFHSPIILGMQKICPSSCGAPFCEARFDRTCWTCLNAPLTSHEGSRVGGS